MFKWTTSSMGDSKRKPKMAKGAKDFDVKTSHTFIDGLINMLTFGMYNPTTTTVTK